MAESFKAGDVVRLKSGGPSMTVVHTNVVGLPNGAACTWFDDKNQVQKASFTQDALETASSDPTVA